MKIPLSYSVRAKSWAKLAISELFWATHWNSLVFSVSIFSANGQRSITFKWYYYRDLWLNWSYMIGERNDQVPIIIFPSCQIPLFLYFSNTKIKYLFAKKVVSFCIANFEINASSGKLNYIKNFTTKNISNYTIDFLSLSLSLWCQSFEDERSKNNFCILIQKLNYCLLHNVGLLWKAKMDPFSCGRIRKQI